MTESIATRSIETNVLLQKVYPVSFRILNDKMEEKIYLEDQPSSGVFEISNDSGRALHFVPAHHGAIAGPDNYHFALKFRPGILKSDVKTLITHKIIQKGWTLSIGLVSLETGEVVTLPPANTGTPAQITQHLEASTIVLYFLNTSKASLAPGEKILLPLKHLRLQADEGTQVTQVELSCKNLAKDPDYTQVLQPHIRHFNLTLINHRGSPIMPIHVGFTGFNAILNDGKSENVLTLRITNQQKRTPQNKGTFTFSHDKHSRMYLYFETDSEQSDYALGTVDQVAGIGLDIVLPQQKEDKDKNTSHLVHEPMFQGDTPIWEIYPEYGDVVLQPHQTKLYPKAPSPLPDDSCLDIELSDIISDCYMGTTHLYLRLENIPGYWDQTYAIPILKQPLVFVDRYNVTITIPSPDQDNSVMQAVNGELKKLTYPTISSKTATIPNLSIHQVKKLKYALVNAGAAVSMVVNGEYVGIGTTAPTNKLSVKGSADFSEKVFANELLVEGSAEFSGNVGIGTKTPDSKLTIKSYYHDENSGIKIDASDKPDTDSYYLKIFPFVIEDSKVGYKFETQSFNGGVTTPLTFSNKGDVNISGSLTIGDKDQKGNLEINHSDNNDVNLPGLKITSKALMTALHIGENGKILIDSRLSGYGGRVSILDDGNVGIGYLHPLKKLSVKGDVMFDGFSISSQDGHSWKNVLIGEHAAILTFIGTGQSTEGGDRHSIYFSIFYNRSTQKIAKIFDLKDQDLSGQWGRVWGLDEEKLTSKEYGNIPIKSERGEEYKLIIVPPIENGNLFTTISIMDNQDALHRKDDIKGRFQSFAL